MSDRSCVTYTIPLDVFMNREEEIRSLIEDPETEDIEDGYVILVCPESTGGGFEGQNALTAANIPFFAYWEAGIEYGDGARCCIPDLGDAVVTISRENYRAPLVTVLPTGSINHDELANGREFLVLLERFSALCAKALFEEIFSRSLSLNGPQGIPNLE